MSLSSGIYKITPTSVTRSRTCCMTDSSVESQTIECNTACWMNLISHSRSIWTWPGHWVHWTQCQGSAAVLYRRSACRGTPSPLSLIPHFDLSVHFKSSTHHGSFVHSDIIDNSPQPLTCGYASNISMLHYTLIIVTPMWRDTLGIWVPFAKATWHGCVKGATLSLFIVQGPRPITPEIVQASHLHELSVRSNRYVSILTLTQTTYFSLQALPRHHC